MTSEDRQEQSEVRPDEVYAMAAAAHDRIKDGWRWANLTGSERDQWLDRACPIVRAVLEIQREASP